MTYDITQVADWLRGSMTALATPFRGGSIDFDAFDTLVERQIDGGTKVLVAVGTTGEASTLSMDEHVEVVKRCVDKVAERIPVIASVGSNDTAATIALAEGAEKAGADGFLSTAGYYNRPSQDGVIAHYFALADASDLPIILYNVPARTASDITVETMAVLSKHPRIVAVKDASANLARVARQRAQCADGFIQLSGEDLTAVGFNSMGGVGCISVTANVVPDLCAEMQNACLAGDYAKALQLQDKLAPLHDALFADSSPTPLKYALSRLGLIAEEVRLPLVPASYKAKRQIDDALAGLGLL